MLSRLLAPLAVLAGVASTGVAASPSSTSSAFFLTGSVPEGWTMHERVAGDEPVPVVIAVKLQNVDELHRHVEEISDPTHERWGQHLSIDEVNAITSNWDGTARVYSWLLSQGIDSDNITLSRGGDFVHVMMTAAEAERTLDASMHRFKHERTGMEAVRTPIYRLPGSIRPVVDFVSTSTLFPSTARRVPRTEIDAKAGAPIPAGYTTPSVIAKTYNIDSTVVASQEATQSVYENLGQDYDEDDLKAFQQQFGLHENQIAKVIGPNDPSQCSTNEQNCGEALLDVEYIMAIAQDSPTTYWSLPNGNTPFLDWITAVAADDNAPLVHSISYGDLESGGEDTTPFKRVCDEISKLSARGITVLASSGDDGVANFGARSDASKCGFTPSFPATCSFITAVGATMGPEAGSEEIACTSDAGGLITTGGGFSTVFDMPSYQASAVSAYLANGPNMPPTSAFNSAGRAYPDVSALGHNFVVAIDGKLTAESGTSASSPTFAAMITLVNGLRIQQGKRALGFLNPTLYGLSTSNPGVFNDIVKGRNNCCAGAPQGQPNAAVCCAQGFSATTGWDPVTGLGSPNFSELSQALLALP